MDPNEALKQIRQAIADMRATQDGGDTEDEITAAYEAVQRFEALDDWLMAGGFLPDQWSRD